MGGIPTGIPTHAAADHSARLKGMIVVVVDGEGVVAPRHNEFVVVTIIGPWA